MKVVVTGGAGFIGANLCRVLADEHEEVVALDDLSTGSKGNLDGARVTLVEGDILDEDLVRSVVAGASAVVHLAARPAVARSLADPLATHRVNATGSVVVLEAARAVGCRHVIVASSSSVYGNTPTLPKHERLAVSPRSPYAASKVAAEAYAQAWASSFGMHILVLRFFNVFGPLQSASHQYAAVVPTFIDRALNDCPLPVHGDGRQTRDFTFVDSVTAVIADAIRNRVAHPEPVNLAFGNRHTLLEVIDMLESILGRPLARQHEPERPGDVRDSQADQTLLRQLFTTVNPVDLETGLRLTVDWFTKQRVLDSGTSNR